MLSELHLMVNPDGEIKSHIIFIHGLQGDYFKTWSSSVPLSEFWPKWLAEDFDGLAIWSVDYDAPVSRMQGTAMHLADRAQNILERILLEGKIRNGEIVFVGHSLGGLVIKQLIRVADSQKDTREEIKSFVNRVGKISFLGTPHAGSDMASYGDKLRILVRPTAATTCLVRNDPNLRELNNWYRNWNLNRDIKHLILMESKPTKILGMIVKPDSADPGLKDNAFLIDCDHESICKPSSKSSEVFLHLQKLISLDLKSPQIMFLKSNYGSNYQGWSGYNNWVNCPNGIEEDYYIDEHVRIYHSSSVNSEGESGLAGIQTIRNLLSRAGSAVRLTGLSGVGKTRLVQALFDERIGMNALSKSDVFYTDINDQPKPPARELVEKLASLKKLTTVIIDNCPPDLHRRLTSICTGRGSTLSLITVEYDVREDQPEETEVFRLEPASIELIERIIRGRFDLSQIDARTIAEFSGGNSRIAIALASTMNKGESLSRLKDSELFERLFYQRYENDQNLLKAAEALSLVYSFKIDVEQGYSEELVTLSDISGVPPSILFESISELKRRDLVQRRGIWGAVLPHAIANRLAQRALENIPSNIIANKFETCGNERLLKSFSRRLGYLNESQHAQGIVEDWLSDGGILCDLAGFNEFKICLLKNIAPISQEKTLQLIGSTSVNDSSKTFLTRKNDNFIEVAKLLRSLSFQEELFSPAFGLLCELETSEKVSENNNPIRDLLKSLFYIHRSGTHASAEQRLLVISNLIDTGCSKRIQLAFELLEASLEAWHFSPHYGFEFGSNSRDYGFYPETREDVEHWFAVFINFAIAKAADEGVVSTKAKQVLGNKFRGLWIKAEMYDLLEQAANNIVNDGWNEGWLGVKSTIRFDKKKLPEDVVSRLEHLEKLLKPSSLVEKIKLYAISSNQNLADSLDDDSIESSYEKTEKMTRQLGAEVSEKREILLDTLPELLIKSGSRLHSFGYGLAQGSSNPTALWNIFRETISTSLNNERNYQLLRGFLESLSTIDLELTNTLLDNSLSDEILSEAFPLLQTSIKIDTRGVARIKVSLEKNTSPISAYNCLAYGRVHESIPDDELSQILRMISNIPDGAPVAIEILSMRLHRNPGEELEVSEVIIAIAQDLLLNYNFSKDNHNSQPNDYSFGRIIEVSFERGSAYSSSLVLCQKLKKAFSEYDIYASDYSHLCEALSRKQPKAFLDGFLGDEEEINYRVGRVLSEDAGYTKNPLSNIDGNTILGWCEENPAIRYPLIASATQPYQSKEGLCEWSELAKKIVEYSPDPIEVLNKYKASFRPTSWIGSRADIMSSRLPLITSLKDHSNHLVVEWAKREEVEFQNEISSEKEGELERDATRDESFEW